MTEQIKPAVLCWDLDGTLGAFAGMRTRNPEFSQPVSLRYGLGELLSEFSEENGYTHYITSSAGLGYITEALNRTHLNKNFSAIFGNDTIQQTSQGKHYRPVAPLTYSEKDIQARMIVIGDSRLDKPVDIGGMVFIELGTPEVPLEALVIREIVTTILDEGNGDFKKGYESLYDKAESAGQSNIPRRKRMEIGADISFAMEYRIANEVEVTKERRVPIICNIKSATHAKPFEVFF